MVVKLVFTWKSELIKDAVSELGPLVDKHLGRVAPRLHSLVPLDQKFCRNGHEVGWLATGPALLGVGAAAVERVVDVDPDVGRLEKKRAV